MTEPKIKKKKEEGKKRTKSIKHVKNDQELFSKRDLEMFLTVRKKNTNCNHIGKLTCCPVI